MAAGTAASRLLGFVRNTLLVAALGLNAASANAYEVANKLPNALFAILAAGVLNAVLVPQIVKAFARADGKRTVDRILTIGFVVSFVATVGFTLAASALVALYSDDWSPEVTGLAVAFAMWCIPQLFFYAVYTLLGQVLNAREKFGPFMWAPAVNNVIGIAGLVVYLAIYGRALTGGDAGDVANLAAMWTPGRIFLIAGVATLGIAAQALVLVRPLLRSGYRWRWTWSGPAGELAGVKRTAAWALAAVLVEQVGVLIASLVTTSAADVGAHNPAIAGNNAYFQALMLVLLPHSLITVSIATALFTSMSRFAVKHDMAGLRGEMSRGLRLIGMFTVFASVVLIALPRQAGRAVFPTASELEVDSLAWVIRALAIGLVPLGIMVLVKWVYFALEDARGVFLIHIPMTVAWIAVAYLGQALLDVRWWTAAVGLGLAASNITGMALRLRGLRARLGGLDGRRVFVSYAQAVAAAVVVVALAWGAFQLLPDVAGTPGWAAWGWTVGALAVTGALMLVGYGALLSLLGHDDARRATAALVSRVRRRVG